MRWALALPVGTSTGRAVGLAEIERRHLVDLDTTELPLETIDIPICNTTSPSVVAANGPFAVMSPGVSRARSHPMW